MKQAAFVLPLTVLLALPARAQETTSAETKRQNVTTLAVRARKAESQGDRVEALKAYEALRTETAQTQDTELVHEHLAATLRAAQTLDALAAASGNASDRATARSHYEAVAAQGDAVQARAARNGLGVLLLREGRPADALAAMREIDIAAVPAPQQFVFHSNLAHGYEATGQLNEALASYKAALAQEPGFGPAQEGAFRVLRLRRPPPVQEAQALVQMLADKGQARAAGERLRDLLIAWAGQAAGSELLPLLARTYVTAKVSPQDFAEGTRPLLAKVTDPALSTALAQLASAYLDEIPLGMDGAEARRRFSAWADGNAKARALAGVLRLVGSLEDAAEHPRQALARAWVAWLIDRRDPENAVAVVSVLEAHPELRDDRMVNELVETLFEAKGEAYAHSDWSLILQLHVILATIFESQGQWSPGLGPRGAQFHWESAARAALQARKEHPEMGPSPGVHQHLAECYRRSGRLPEAWREFVTTAEGFLEDRRPDLARIAVRQSHELGWHPEQAEDLERLRKLEAQIEGSRPG